MDTEIIKIRNLDSTAKKKLKAAAEVIKNGGLVVFPTETVYGLGADATNETAVKKIYEAKGRPSDNPLIIHVARPEDAEEYTYTSHVYYRLAEAFMPGPITVIMKSKPTIPKKTRGGLDTVAVRCPAEPVARALIEYSGTPIAAPSANLSGSPSPTTSAHAIKDMKGRVDVIIDGNDSDFGLESTIVKIEDDGSLTLLRPGKITPADIEVLGIRVNIADAVISALKEGEVALSPGMKYRHYAPKAPVVLLDGDADSAISYVRGQGEERVAIISYFENIEKFKRSLPNAYYYDFGSIGDEAEQAKRLFAILRDADERSFDIIYAPLPEKRGIALALYNRMIRAAAHKIINLRR